MRSRVENQDKTIGLEFEVGLENLSLSELNFKYLIVEPDLIRFHKKSGQLLSSQNLELGSNKLQASYTPCVWCRQRQTNLE